MAAIVPSISNTDYFQPIIRGVQNVGSVQILYRYNFKHTDDHYYLPIPGSFKFGTLTEKSIDLGTGNGMPVAGFRLDAEFLRANPQIASSLVIPILGGGGVALTNNNRTGTLNLVCTKVCAPDLSDTTNVIKMAAEGSNGMAGMGVKNKEGSAQAYYDFVTLAQLQQGQEGGDSYGAQIQIKFGFCGITTTITFEGCTIATVDPIGLAGNDAVNYAIAVNYLNWTLAYDK